MDTVTLTIRSVERFVPGDRIVGIGARPLPVERVVKRVESKAVLLEHPEPNPHGVEWRVYADTLAEQGAEVVRVAHPPAWRAQPYRPQSGLTKFQKEVLAALSRTEPRRAIDLGLGDPRGVGASIAALAQRGYVGGNGKDGYVLNETVSPAVRRVRLMYYCEGCKRRYFAQEVSADLRSHESIAGHRCPHPQLRAEDAGAQ